jgi:hypothetical protein
LSNDPERPPAEKAGGLFWPACFLDFRLDGVSGTDRHARSGEVPRQELHADVNAFDHEGNTALHHAAARGDVKMIQYLVSKGVDVKAVTREGKTTADMANGSVQRIQPWPEALELLEGTRITTKALAAVSDCVS